jgi:hypothetical protein
LSGKEKDSFLKDLNNSYHEIDSMYVNYIEKLASLESEQSQKLEMPAKETVSFFEVLKSFKPNPILKLKTNNT